MDDTFPRRTISWKEPILHFFLLGLVVFGLRAWLEGHDHDTTVPNHIEITSAEVDWFRTIWEKRTGREPAPAELRGQVNQMIKELILSREAERLGLDRNDEIIRQRLARKMDYLFRDMASAARPTDEALKTFLTENRQRYEIPGSLTFEQVFFSTDERGMEGAEEAVALFLEHPDGEGDPTMLARRYETISMVRIRGLFGNHFADQLPTLETGKWSGPVKSSYGLHAVYIAEQMPAAMPSVEDIRDRLTEDWSTDQQWEASQAAYAEIRKEYDVTVEGMPYSLDTE